jgi:hypothetical protein
VDPVVSVPVLWAVDGAAHVAGRLDVYDDRLRLDGGSRDDRRMRDIAATQIETVRIGRGDHERIAGRPVLVLELRSGEVVTLVGFHQPGSLHELAERLRTMASTEPEP